jgi:hypothetical protein
MDNFTQLRLRLGIRKAMLNLADRQLHRSMLMTRFPWAKRTEVAAAINQCLADGVLTEEKGQMGAPILTWHEEAIK